MTKIIVNNVWSRISGLNDIETVDNLDKITSFYVEGYQYSRAFRNGFYDQKTGQFRHWDGKRHLLTSKMVFPTGLLARVCDFFKLHNIEYLIEDNRKFPPTQEELPIFFTPRFYQEEAVKEAIKNHRGIIRLGTGSGKTLAATMITAKYNLPSIIYVVGKDLLYQFHREMEKALKIEIGIIGDGNCKIMKHNVCSIWTAATAFDLKTKVLLDDEDWSPEIVSVDKEQKIAIKKAIENSYLNIYDEAQFLATDTLQLIFKASKKCVYCFGMTGTDWRDDGADLLLEAVCGNRIYNMSSSKLIDLGYLVQPKVVLINVPELITKPKAHYATIYSDYIVNNKTRNFLIEDATRKLINKGRKVLILVKQLAHGKVLSEILHDVPLYFVNGEVDAETRTEVKQRLEDGTLKCLIASSVFDIGVDIPSLDAIVLGGGGKSTTRALQRIGRVIRKAEGKKNALVIDFIDNCQYLDKHSATRIAVYESESKFIISFPKGFDKRTLKKPKKITQKIQ